MPAFFCSKGLTNLKESISLYLTLLFLFDIEAHFDEKVRQIVMMMKQVVFGRLQSSVISNHHLWKGVELSAHNMN